MRIPTTWGEMQLEHLSLKLSVSSYRLLDNYTYMCAKVDYWELNDTVRKKLIFCFYKWVFFSAVDYTYAEQVAGIISIQSRI